MNVNSVFKKKITKNSNFSGDFTICISVLMTCDYKYGPQNNPQVFAKLLLDLPDDIFWNLKNINNFYNNITKYIAWLIINK